MTYYVQCLSKYACFKGRARRQEYWMFNLIQFLIGIILAVADKILETGGSFWLVYTIATILPSTSVMVRRLHDIGLSGGYWFIGLIPFVGPFIELVMLCRDSAPGSNEYGENPKGVSDVPSGNNNNAVKESSINYEIKPVGCGVAIDRVSGIKGLLVSGGMICVVVLVNYMFSDSDKSDKHSTTLSSSMTSSIPALGDKEKVQSKMKINIIEMDLEELEAKAIQGDVEAQYLWGMICLKKNAKQGADFLLKAATQGFVLAEFELGHCYAAGNGVEEDDSVSFQWYLKAAKKGLADAQVAVGACLIGGFVVDKNEYEGMNWYRRAAEQGYAPAQYNLASCFYKMRNVPEALKWLRMAAGQGLVEAVKALTKIEKIYTSDGRLRLNRVKPLSFCGITIGKVRYYEWRGGGEFEVSSAHPFREFSRASVKVDSAGCVYAVKLVAEYEVTSYNEQFIKDEIICILRILDKEYNWGEPYDPVRKCFVDSSSLTVSETSADYTDASGYNFNIRCDSCVWDPVINDIRRKDNHKYLILEVTNLILAENAVQQVSSAEKRHEMREDFSGINDL